jgi:hypothetical protein
MSDFDLPRWTAPTHDHVLSSSTSNQPSYLYAGTASPGGGGTPGAGAPPPPSLLAGGGRPQPSPSRTTRLTQLLDSDLGSASPYGPPPAVGASPYQQQQGPPQQASLGRSASFGGAALTARGRRNRVQDDLEGAFHEDADMAGPQTPSAPASGGYPAGAYYTPGHHHSLSAVSGPPPSADQYQESYFGSGALGGTPRRANTHRDAASRAPLSPPAASAGPPLSDPYSPPQLSAGGGGGQYSPALGGYAYGGGERAARTNPSSPYAHSRSHSHVNTDSGSGGLSSPLSFAQAPGGAYAPYGGMELSTSPQPPAHHLGSGGPHGHSVSTPSSPTAGMHHYGFAPQHGYDTHPGAHQMAVDMPPPPPRRVAPVDAFRRVRDARDLQPRNLNQSTVNRRIDPMTQEILSVRPRVVRALMRADTDGCVDAAFEATDDAPRGHVPDMQPCLPL